MWMYTKYLDFLKNLRFLIERIIRGAHDTTWYLCTTVVFDKVTAQEFQRFVNQDFIGTCCSSIYCRSHIILNVFIVLI